MKAFATAAWKRGKEENEEELEAAAAEEAEEEEETEEQEAHQEEVDVEPAGTIELDALHLEPWEFDRFLPVAAHHIGGRRGK
jgi:hypothetical protein